MAAVLIPKVRRHPVLWAGVWECCQLKHQRPEARRSDSLQVGSRCKPGLPLIVSREWIRSAIRHDHNTYANTKLR